MKSEVLKRAMFVMPLSKAARNSGIMEGFEDEDFEDMESQGLEEMPPMARTPQNPEILMNNLRGDILSTDSRYQELADMVGEEAAMETPPEVLAMLQPIFAQQQQGIAGLPQGQQMMGQEGGQAPMPQGPGPEAGGMPPEMAGGMPPEMAGGMPPEMAGGMPPEMAGGMPPEMAGIAALPVPQGMAPSGTPPQGFAGGGFVQHFSDGSDEEGVTPAESIYPPDVVAAARKEMLTMMNATPRAVPNLGATMQARLPIYQELLGMGRSQEDMQTQMLLDLASRGLAFAGNVDDQGRRLTGSFASRLGQATRTLPGTMMGLLSEKRKGEMLAKQLALQAAEKEIGQTQELNARDVEARRKLLVEVLKADAKAQGQSIFGKGDWHLAVLTRPQFLASWAEGKTTPDQDNLIDAAITTIKQPRIETQIRTDPVTNQQTTVTVQIPATVPQFVLDAEKLRKQLFPGGAPSAAVAPSGGAPSRAPAGAAAPSAVTVTPTAGQRPPAEREIPAAQSAVSAYAPGEPTLFNLAEKGTGFMPVARSFLNRVPIVGEFVPADENVQARTYIDNAVNQLNKSLATNPRFAEGERQQIMRELELSTRLIDRPEAYHSRLIGLDSLLVDLRGKAFREGYQNPNLGPVDIRAARAKVDEIDQIRTLLGVPPRVTSMAQFEALPPGSPYILKNKLMMKAPAGAAQ